MKTFQETYVSYPVTEGEGAEQTTYLKASTEEKHGKLVSENPATAPIAKSQSFLIYQVETDEDILALVPDQDERIALFNRAVVSKQQAVARGMVTDKEFDPVEGAYDLADEAARKTERVKLSPIEKAQKALGNLTAEQMQEVLALFAAQNAPAKA
jgi:hypothetical protein